MTLREALAAGFSQFYAVPRLQNYALQDAAYLLRHTLAISQASLLANYDRCLTLEEQADYQASIARRLTNEPIQYITGEQEFYGLALHVTPAVLIPRPETEMLVEAVLAELDASAQLRILDVGTGSGAIAIALAHHLPNARITAVDLSPTALEIAASNATRHQLADRIRFVESDLLEALAPCDSNFDAIVSNPPYVPLADRDALEPQIRDYEPALALFGGDGLELHRRLIPQVHSALKPNGLLALEFGDGMRDPVASLLTAWKDLRFVDDLQHIPRVALARKP